MWFLAFCYGMPGNGVSDTRVKRFWGRLKPGKHREYPDVLEPTNAPPNRQGENIWFGLGVG